MKDNGTSQNYQKGDLKTMIHFVGHIGLATCFYDVDHKEVLRFLNAKIKFELTDPDKSTKTPLFNRTVPGILVKILEKIN